MNARLRGAAALTAILTPVLQRKIEELGEEESGADNFYARRAESGWIFSVYDLAVVEALLQRDLQFDCIHDIGAGLGQLTFLLGWNGFRAVGFEHDQKTYRTGKLLLDALTLADPRLAENITLRGEVFPAQPEFGYLGDYGISQDIHVPEALFPPLRPADTSNSLALCTNIAATIPPELQFKFVQGMLHYRAAVIDVDRFFGTASEPDDRDRVFGLFSRAGFTRAEPFLDLGADGCYFMFSGHQRPSQSPSLDLAALGQRAIEFLHGWIGHDKDRRASAGNYYLSKFDRAEMFEKYDVVVAQYAAARLPKEARFFELGSGYGELCLMLALKGVKVTAIESDRERHNGAVAWYRELSRIGLALNNLDHINGTFPNVMDFSRGRKGGTVLLATDVTSSSLSKTMPQVRDAFSRFDHIVIDLLRFGGEYGARERDELIAGFNAAEFIEVASVFQDEEGGVDIRHYAAKHRTAI